MLLTSRLTPISSGRSSKNAFIVEKTFAVQHVRPASRAYVSHVLPKEISGHTKKTAFEHLNLNRFGGLAARMTPKRSNDNTFEYAYLNSFRNVVGGRFAKIIILLLYLSSFVLVRNTRKNTCFATISRRPLPTR